MQISSFRIFRDLAETASFSRAATMNHVTQSAVSQQVRAMEVRFGVTLVERGRRGFSLTAEGRVFLDVCRRVLSAVDTLGERLKGVRDVVAGELRLATVQSIGLHELPPFLRIFQKQFPEVRLEIDYLRSGEIYDRIQTGEIDLGLVAFPARRAGIVVEAIARDRLVLICAPGHRLSKKKSVSPSELEGEAFVLFDPDLPTRKAIDRMFKRAKVRIGTVREFDNIETVKRAVEIERGVSIVPETTVIQERRSRTLMVLEIEAPEIERPLGVIYSRTSPASPLRQRFIEALRKHGLDVKSKPAGRRAS